MAVGPLSEWAIAAATIFGLLFAARQVREAVNTSLKADMREIAAALSDPRFREHMAQIRAVFDWGDWENDRAKLWSRWQALPEPERGRCLAPLNKLETLSLMSRASDKKQAKRLWGSTAIAIWTEAEPFILAYRDKRSRPTAYEEFGRLVEYFRDKDGHGAVPMSIGRKIIYGIGIVLMFGGWVVAVAWDFRALPVGVAFGLIAAGLLLIEWAVDEKLGAKWLVPWAGAFVTLGAVELGGAPARVPVGFYAATAQIIPVLLIALLLQAPELRRKQKPGILFLGRTTIILLMVGEATALIASTQGGAGPSASGHYVAQIAAAVAGGFIGVLVASSPPSGDRAKASTSADS